MRHVTLLFLILLTGCHFRPSASDAVVPSDWYRSPESGAAAAPGSIQKFGALVDRIFDAQSRALEPLAGTAAADEVPAHHPLDWVPWRLAGVSTSFAVTGEGAFGALLFEGTASVQANWVRADASPLESKRKAELHISGTATSTEVALQLEPAIRAALSSGAVKNERALRANVLAAAESFRAIAARLSGLKAGGIGFLPTAFILEVEIGAEGEIVPGTGVGGAVEFRFDWMKNFYAKPRVENEATQIGDAAASNLERFVTAIAPDLDEAALEAKVLENSGFGLQAIKIGLGMTAEGEFAIGSASAGFTAAIRFGSTAEDCYDPDGDGDCHPVHPHPHPIELASLDHLKLIKAEVKAPQLDFAKREGVAFSALRRVHGKDKGAVFKIRHDKFRAGLRKATRMGAFFAKRAHAARVGAWKIQELETEFEMAISGGLGLATLEGHGEIELEFMNKGR